VTEIEVRSAVTLIAMELTGRNAREAGAVGNRLSGYLKAGFGGAHTESNQRLMYTSA
jgi:uncharacterized protein YdbL (DUF1318 family)